MKVYPIVEKYFDLQGSVLIFLYPKTCGFKGEMILAGFPLSKPWDFLYKNKCSIYVRNKCFK